MLNDAAKGKAQHPITCTQGFGAGTAGGPRNALYNTQGGAFKASPHLPALGWTLIEVRELDLCTSTPSPKATAGPGTAKGQGWRGSAHASARGKPFCGAKSSFPATRPTNQAGDRAGRASRAQHGDSGQGKTLPYQCPLLQPRRDDVGQGRGLLFLR